MPALRLGRVRAAAAAPAALALVAGAACAALGGCHAGLGDGARARGAASGAASGDGPLRVVERGEPGPITGLALAPPYLYAGTARGLRRCDVSSDEYEWIDPVAALAGGRVSALGADDGGNLWVATETGLSRLSRNAAEGERLAPMAPLPGVSLLLPVAGGRAPSAWAGGEAGLYRVEGRDAHPVDELRDVPVTSLDRAPFRGADALWVGTRGHGLYRIDAARPGHAERVLAADPSIPLDEVVGTAVTSAGTRVVAARAFPGRGVRLVFITRAGAEAFRAQPEVPVVRLLDGGGDAVLVAGAPGAERAFSLRPLDKGEASPEGGLRFVPIGRGAGAGRWAAVPLPDLPPPGVTAALAGAGGALYFGSARMGVARGASERPRYLSGSTLVGDAERLYVACAARRRCFAVTEGPRAWRTDGDSYVETRVGEADDARVLAVAGDAAGAVYALVSEPRFTGLVLTRLEPGDDAAAAAGGDSPDRWQPFLRVPLQLPVNGPPAVTMLAFAPPRTLWVGVRTGARVGAADDDDGSGFGAVEIDLDSRRVTQHMPLPAGEIPLPGGLPLPPSPTGLLFDGDALWFSSMAGVGRWADGALQSWGENQGMPSERVHALARGLDGAVWAATSEGVARFDGKWWRPVAAAEAVATRALARDGAGRVWLATSKGLRVLGPEAPDAATSAAAEPVVAGDMRDAVADRFGRIWALSSVSISLVEGDPSRAPGPRGARLARR